MLKIFSLFSIFSLCHFTRLRFEWLLNCKHQHYWFYHIQFFEDDHFYDEKYYDSPIYHHVGENNRTFFAEVDDESDGWRNNYLEPYAKIVHNCSENNDFFMEAYHYFPEVALTESKALLNLTLDMDNYGERLRGDELVYLIDIVDSNAVRRSGGLGGSIWKRLIDLYGKEVKYGKMEQSIN